MPIDVEDLLGVEGITVIAHGRSDALAIQNAIRAAKEAVDGGTLEAIRSIKATRTQVGIE